MKILYNGYEIEIIMLALSGSRLYDNYTEKSDYDYRGIFIADKSTKLGLIGKVEQIEDPEFFKELNDTCDLGLKDFSDCLIYEINRFATLCADANPNIFDILCAPIEKCIYINDKGKELIDNRKLFLSSKLKFTFSGYAISQLAKIKNRDKYLTKYPDVSNVLQEVQECYYNKFIDFTWICDNFGGVVADFITNESPQDNKKLEKCISWKEFKNLVEEGRNIVGLKRIANMDMYRIPQLLSYCNAKDLRGAKYNLHEFTTNLLPDLFTLKSDDMSLSKFLQTKASFRPFSPSMLAIYTEGTGIFTANGKLKSAEPEHIGEFVCLLSIDQMKYKADRDFNAAMWEWKCKRNETRSAMEAEFGIDLKNLSHLWRLMTKAKEILQTGDYNPELVGEELETLRGIRDGSLYGKDSYDFALKFAEENDKELDELYKTTLLPKKPDMKKINDLVLRLQDVKC